MIKASVKLKKLLETKKVDCSDPWRVEGEKGIAGIRNKLAHRGSDGVHHQGLAVASFHLSLILERLVFSLLGLSLDRLIFNQQQRDEWSQIAYVDKVKDGIFRVDAE